MQRQSRWDTKPELQLCKELHRLGLRYCLDRSVLPESRRRHDIVFPRQKVVVDVFGCFWHGCPERATRPKADLAWWAEKLGADLARHGDTKRRLAEAGWLLLVIREHESPTEAAQRVQKAVRGARDGLVRE